MGVDLELDPFQQTYNALWALAEGSARLTSLVRPGNRIKFNGQTWTFPVKKEVGDADLPELALLVTSLTGKIRSTSSSSDAKMRFEWWISTGDPSVIRNILPVMFAVYAAMTPWISIAQDNSTYSWRGKPFVKLVDLVEANFSLSDAEKNRGIRGWTAVWACEVTVYMTTSDVITASQETLQ